MPKNSKQQGYVERYGLYWEQLVHPVEVELQMIRRGGKWKTKQGKDVGNGLFYHYKRLQQLLDPEKAWTKWNDLLLKSFIENRFIAVIGPASSGKTREAADFARMNYYVWFDQITVLLTSTERERLEERVWGEIKAGHKKAKGVYDQLPGSLIESRQRLVTDVRTAENEGRDFRSGMVCLPAKKGGQFVGLGCFKSGTSVETLSGHKPIEQISSGEYVLGAMGFSRVKSTQSRVSGSLLRLHLSGCAAIDCTPDHPFFTDAGWVKAVDITRNHSLISTNEAMSILRKPRSVQTQASAVLQREMQEQGKTQNPPVQNMQPPNCDFNSRPQEILLTPVQKGAMEEEVCFLQEELCAIRGQGDFLLSELLSEVEIHPTGDSEEIRCPSPRQGGNEKSGKSCKQSNKKQSRRVQEAIRKSQSKEGSCGFGSSPKELDQAPRLRPESIWESRQRIPENKSREAAHKSDARSHIRADYSFRQRSQEFHTENRLPTLLQARFCMADGEAGSRNRRGITRKTKTDSPRSTEGIYFKRIRVDHIEILEPTSANGYDERESGYRVHNLEVENHPSYSIQGVLVHNSFSGVKNKRLILVGDELQFCPSVYIDSISNLNKNPEFKAIGLGNPKDITDALGKFAEPAASIGGWDGGIDQSGPTKTWPTRWKNGIAVQLVGTDCPNMDVPEDAPVPYPFLITREAIASDVQYYGQDSIQHSMMNLGRFPRGEGSRRVITRMICLKFGAMEAPVWKDETRTRIGFVDPAYSGIGGDRSIFGELQFGPDVNGKQIMALISTILIPVTADNPDIPEDQIANFVMEQCKTRNIPAENLFFDSTGRGSLALAFARLWSPSVVGIEFGGKPSERQVSTQNPCKACDYYSKKVSELWFNVRHIILAGQFRGMSDEVMSEGIYREWRLVGANKTEVETKADTKIKSGRSTDNFDALACGVEGALQRGFVIANTASKAATALTNNFKERIEERLKRLRQSYELTYS